MHGYVGADEIESRGPLAAINVRAYSSIDVRGLLKSKQFIFAKGSIIINGSIIAGWSVYSGVWIRAKGFIVARKGSISATEYIVSDGPIIAHSWVTCSKKIEAGHSILAGEYIKAQEISAGEKSKGDFLKQTIKAEKIEGQITHGTVLVARVEDNV